MWDRVSKPVRTMGCPDDGYRIQAVFWLQWGSSPKADAFARNLLTCYTTALLNLAHSDQDQRFAAAFRILEEAITARAFPAAAVAVLHHGNLIALRSFGRFTYDPDSPCVTPDTIFDLASVSKVVATTTAAAILYERGKLDLDTCVDEIAFEFQTKDVRRADITIRQLLTHSSGLPAYVRLFETCRTREDLLKAAYTTKLEADPGTRTEYSDIGFIILGDILERIAGEPLVQFCHREIFAPLGLTHTRFNPQPEWRDQIPPTRDDQTFRHKVIQGEVNDENAWVMGGVAGHAGVFAPAAEIAAFAHSWLGVRLKNALGAQSEHQLGARSFDAVKGPVLSPDTIAEFTRPQPGTTRALGWDRPTAPSSSGQFFSPQSYGHLGYTGTSLWIDPTRSLAVVLLTNRTWPDASNQTIKQIRPRFHDAVIEAL
jgi:serine-type D-Ala-D-Ala carboxypeptidase